MRPWEMEIAGAGFRGHVTVDTQTAVRERPEERHGRIADSGRRRQDEDFPRSTGRVRLRSAVRAAAAWAPPVKARSAVAGAQALTAAGG